MKAADLYRLMESPALLTEDTLQQLKQIVDEFPYFQIARMLYLKKPAALRHVDRRGVLSDRLQGRL